MACWRSEVCGGLCLVTCRLPRSLYFYRLLCCLFLTCFAAAAACPTSLCVLPALASTSHPPCVLQGEPACSRCCLFIPVEMRLIRCDLRHLTANEAVVSGARRVPAPRPVRQPPPRTAPALARRPRARRWQRPPQRSTLSLHRPLKLSCRAAPAPTGLAAVQGDQKFLRSYRPRGCRRGDHPRRKGPSVSAGPQCAPAGSREPVTLTGKNGVLRAGPA